VKVRPAPIGPEWWPLTRALEEYGPGLCPVANFRENSNKPWEVLGGGEEFEQLIITYSVWTLYLWFPISLRLRGLVINNDLKLCILLDH
jgi:hypothetical protein